MKCSRPESMRVDALIRSPSTSRQTHYLRHLSDVTPTACALRSPLGRHSIKLVSRVITLRGYLAGPSGPAAWNVSWNESHENCVRLVLSGHTSAASVQAERSVRRSGPLLIRGFGVQVPGGAPVLTCPNCLLKII